jgi:predicted metal-dependent phosphoesterase TrpH
MAAEVDLHLHTTCSDGRLTPSELIRLAASQGLKVVSVTDHDSTEGLAEANEAVREFPQMRIIAGIELSTDIPGDEIHMLGYFIKYDDAQFQDTLLRFRRGRVERARLMVEKLDALGIHLDWDRVQEIAGDGSVGRPHIALAMVEAGYCTEPQYAFPEYLGRNGLAYVERPKMLPAEAVEMILGIGGVPVLAHPAYMLDMRASIAQLVPAGLMGMEVYYSRYRLEVVQELAQLAKGHGLIPCGGSDYHGLGNTDEPLPGTQGPPMETVERLEEAAEKLAQGAK